MDLYQRAYRRIKQAQASHMDATSVYCDDASGEDIRAVVERLRNEGYDADSFYDFTAYIAVSWRDMP